MRPGWNLAASWCRFRGTSGPVRQSAAPPVERGAAAGASAHRRWSRRRSGDRPTHHIAQGSFAVASREMVIPLAECAHMLGMDGPAISLRAGDGCVELVQHSDEPAALADDVQYTQGRGPTPDVARRGSRVMLPDLASEPDTPWPGLIPDLQQLGIQAVFALPMQIRGAQLGVLTGHRCSPGNPTSEQWAGTSAADALLRIKAHAYAHGQPLLATATSILGHRLRLEDDPPGQA
ncbi:GAF domain-containing protein [Streptomyces sp. NPDC086554]|uniref:GAF domain-containing protein n=1 Tax=Streptomyces sp. NPDC086554 TaxID=3154864 RepID=UPI00343632B2